MAIVSRRLVFDVVATRLVGVSNATGYYGQVGRALPGQEATTPKDPPVKAADDPRVKPYFVLYPGAGTNGPDAPLVGLDDGLALGFRVAAAAGDIDDMQGLIDRLDALLVGWIPTLTGVSFGRVGRLPGSNPGILLDRTVSPERLLGPLDYLLTATT